MWAKRMSFYSITIAFRQDEIMGRDTSVPGCFSPELYSVKYQPCAQCFKTVDRQRIANREKEKMVINGENYKMVSRCKRKEESKNGQMERNFSLLEGELVKSYIF